MTPTGANDNPLGRAVVSRRGALGFKRKDLAERARLSYPYISEIENGAKEPSAKALRQIAEALQLSVAELAALTEQVADAGQVVASAPEPPVGDVVVSAAALSTPGSDTEWASAAARSHRGVDLDAEQQSSTLTPHEVRRIVRSELDRWVAEDLPPIIARALRDARELPGVEDES